MLSRPQAVGLTAHKMRTSILSCYISGILLLLISCTEDLTVNPPVEKYPDLCLNAEDSLEAIHIATFWDELLLPTDSTVESQLYHLNYLRQYWIDSLEWIAEQRFMPPWKMGMLLVGFDDTTAQAIISGTYNGFQTLETHLLPDSVGIPDRLYLTKLYYDEPYNPLRYGEIIDELPGVRFAEPNFINFLEWFDFPIQIGIIRNEWAYLFHRNSQQCPHHYFRYNSGVPVYYGEIFYNSDSVHLGEVSNIRSQWKEKSY